jgi:hypothetical protein
MRYQLDASSACRGEDTIFPARASKDGPERNPTASTAMRKIPERRNVQRLAGLQHGWRVGGGLPDNGSGSEVPGVG